MGELAAGGQRLSFEQIARSDAAHVYVLAVTYHVDGTETRTDEVTMDVARRQEVTREAVAGRLEEWKIDHPRARIARYEVYARIECRKGEDVTEPGAEREGWSIDGPEPGVAPTEIRAGDRVAYYAGGPRNAIYGYLTEGIVEEVVPNERRAADAGRVGYAKLNLGTQRKPIPLAWIVGPVDDPEIATAIDRRREDL